MPPMPTVYKSPLPPPPPPTHALSSNTPPTAPLQNMYNAASSHPISSQPLGYNSNINTVPPSVPSFGANINSTPPLPTMYNAHQNATPPPPPPSNFYNSAPVRFIDFAVFELF